MRKPRVFVVMPYGRKEVRSATGATDTELERPAVEVDFDRVYQELISPALVKAGCEPFRADEQGTAGDIRTDMFFELVTADFVLADISIHNANVFYELGVRHGVAERGVLMIHGGWSQRIFDVVTDRTFDYDGTLFQVTDGQAATPTDRICQAVSSLAETIEQAITTDDQTISSPVYKELVDLRPVEWSRISPQRAKYFRGVIQDWKGRASIAAANNRSGDLLTLAADAPTRYQQEDILFKVAKNLVGLERYRSAKPVLEEVLKISPKHKNALCQLGLVLNRIGRVPEALEHMKRIAKTYQGDPEVQGIIGRVYKDMWRSRWEEESEPDRRQRLAASNWQLAAAASRSYETAFLYNFNSYYNGINVIAFKKMSEHLSKASDCFFSRSESTDTQDLAAIVRVAASNQLQQSLAMNKFVEAVWAAATLGEVGVLTGNTETAVKFYSDAASMPDITPFNITSMLDQLRMYQALGFETETVEKIISELERRIGNGRQGIKSYERVAICSGHMIDRTDRDEPRFPPEKEDVVRQAIGEHLDSWGIGKEALAICGGARGTDIIFSELCYQREAQIRLLLPLAQGEFLRRSVSLPGSVDWEQRFFDIKAKSQCLFQPDCIGPPPRGITGFERNNLWIISTALAEIEPDHIYCILVWDEQPSGDGPGGTSDFARKVRELGGHVKIINPLDL